MTGRDVPRRTVLRGGAGALALAGLSGLAACGSGSPRTTELQPVKLVAQREKLVPKAVSDLAAVVTGIDGFGGRLHRAGATIDANFTASPFSIAVAFAMLRAGARAATGQAIDHALGFPAGADPGVVHPALNALTAALITTTPVGTAPSPTASNGEPADPIVAIANGLFLQSGEQLQSAYLRLLATQYGVSPFHVDFHDLDRAAATVNTWVSQQTRKRITMLFDELDPATVLVLANAVYLKADWGSPFDKSLTKDGAFTTPTRSVTAPLMGQQLEEAGYATGTGWQRVVLPYARGLLTMRIVLPDRVITQVPDFAPAVAAATSSTKHDVPRRVALTLPRWNTGDGLDLTKILTGLGMGAVFDSRANLNGIEQGRGLYVGQAVHRANITVDEHGTEAAAVTGIDAVASSASAAPLVTFTVNRPFAWAIVHEPTGTPLFLGHVVDPTA